MTRKITGLVFGLMLGILLPGLLLAQRGTIAGKVVDTRSGDALPGANVLVQGLDVGAATNIDGEFRLESVPAGTHSVIARFIGYKSLVKQVTVSGGAVVELNFNLSETALQLDEVVVTGTGIASEKRKLGNTVATVNSAAIQDAPVTSLSEILQGREPGVNAIPSGGLTGEGTRIRIRGSSSLSQSNEPIIYIDGVRVDNAGGFAGVGNVAVGAGGGGVPSRLDDINPESIDRVEILKGAAAATLYGTQANAGIIQVFTKQGTFGKPRFTLEIEQAAINYPDVYKPNAGFAHTEAQLANMRTVFNDPSLQLYQIVEQPFVKNLFTTGYGQTYSLGVSGGGSGVTYFANARYLNTNGPYGPGPEDFLGKEPGPAVDKLNRAQFSATLGVLPTSKLNIRLSTSYNRIRQETIDNNNNIYGVISSAMFGKPERVVPLNSLGQGNALGNAAFATTRETSYQQTSDATDHATVSLASAYKVGNELSLDATFGVDYVSQRSTGLVPFGWNVDGIVTATTEGVLGIGKREHTEWTLDLKGNWNRNLTSTISSSFVAGLQGFITNETSSYGEGTTFPAPGIEVLQGGAVRTGNSSSFLEVVQAGYFFQEQLGYRDYLYLTGGVRFDANSAFGSNFSTATYPKLSVSFVPSTAFNMSSTPLSTLRLRAAVGRSGQQPGAFDKLTTFISNTSTDGAGVSPGNLGNEDLQPETSTEWELGFEAGLFSDRLGLEFTYWDRTVNDALVARAYAPSGGFWRTQLSNIGELKAHGMDLEANFRILKKEDLAIEVFANGAFLREEIIDLGGAPPLKSGGAYQRYRNFLIEGYAPGAFFGAKLNTSAEYAIDLNRDLKPETREALLAFFSQARDPSTFYPLVVNEDGDADLLDHYLGKPAPDWQGAFGLNMTFFRRFRLASLFEYKAGNFYVHNLTDEFRRFHASIGRNIRSAAELEAILINPASTAEQRLAAADQWARENYGLSPYDGLNAIEQADLIRWREVSLTYDIPRNIFSGFGVDNASITVAGRNLALISGYSGLDPEINAIGRGGISTGAPIDTNYLIGTEAFGLPVPRQFVFTLRAGF